MRKFWFFALVFVVMFSALGYAQTETETETDEGGNLFFAVGFYNGFFVNDSLPLFPDADVTKYSPVKVGGYWEMPKWNGYLSFGLESGFASGSQFGGGGGTNFIPLMLSGAYAYPVIGGFSIGPSVKLGGLAGVNPDWFKVIPLIGARIEAELQLGSFPLSLYASGGADFFPMSASILPMVEAGIRFPRGKWGGDSRRAGGGTAAAAGAGIVGTVGAGAGAGASGGTGAGGVGSGTGAGTGAGIVGSVGAGGGAGAAGGTGAAGGVGGGTGAGTGAGIVGTVGTGAGAAGGTGAGGVGAGTGAGTGTGIVGTIGAGAGTGAAAGLSGQTQSPVVTAITVNPPISTVTKGQAQSFGALISGNNNPSQSVNWTVSGGGIGTTISPNGVLTVAPNESATNLTVRATSTVDPSKSATATVAVNSGVTAVAVNPPISTVTRGQTQPFGALISGNNNPAQAVNWSVSGGGIGTTINSNGILTVAPNESATNLTVRATSTADPSKSATAVVALTGAVAAAGQGTTPDQEIRTSTVQRTTPAPIVNFAEHHRPGFFRAVYFEPDSAVLIEDSRHIIEGVGQEMASDPGLRVVLRSFTAPFGTAAGREMVSGARVNFCRNYLMQNYHITSDRIATESWASERLPENAAGTDWVTYRCVEFIVSGY